MRFCLVLSFSAVLHCHQLLFFISAGLTFCLSLRNLISPLGSTGAFHVVPDSYVSPACGVYPLDRGASVEGSKPKHAESQHIILNYSSS